MPRTSWRSKVPKLCGAKNDVEEHAWTYCAPWRFPFTCMLWASVSRTELPLMMLSCQLFIDRNERGADTHVGFYVCECGVLFITCKWCNALSWNSYCLALHCLSCFLMFRRYFQTKMLWSEVSLKVSHVGFFFLLWGEVTDVNCQVGF